MPEPVTLVIGGIALYGLLKPKAVPTPAQVAAAPAASTSGLQPVSVVPAGSMATPTGTVNNQVAGVTLGATIAGPLPVQPDQRAAPTDIVAVLDNDTAM